MINTSTSTPDTKTPNVLLTNIDPLSASAWSEQTTTDGRKFYYNHIVKYQIFNFFYLDKIINVG
jgi:hypothetical protein